MFDADLYRLVHRGNAGDLAFYRRLCRGAGRVLELGCGAGRIAGPIAADGADVVGIEPHPGMRAACAGFEVRDGDMRSFAIEGRRFDRVIVPYTGLYCLPDDDAVLDCFRCVARHLAPGGRFAFDGYLVHPELPAGGDEPEWLTTVYDDDDDRIDIFESGEHFPESRRFAVTYDHELHGSGPSRRTSYTLDHHYLVAGEVPAMLDSAGLALAHLFGDFDESPFIEETAERLVVVARRP